MGLTHETKAQQISVHHICKSTYVICAFRSIYVLQFIHSFSVVMLIHLKQ